MQFRENEKRTEKVINSALKFGVTKEQIPFHELGKEFEPKTMFKNIGQNFELEQFFWLKEKV